MPPYVSWPAGYDIDPNKLFRYLLDPQGKAPSKAKWFLSQGFDGQTLAAALFQHTTIQNYQSVFVSPFGLKFTFEGPMVTPKQLPQNVLSIWQVRYDTALGQRGIACLVTAYHR